MQTAQKIHFTNLVSCAPVRVVAKALHCSWAFSHTSKKNPFGEDILPERYIL